MSFVISLPRYRCHKEVSALKIEHVFQNPRGIELHFVDKRFVPIQMPLEWYRKHAMSEGKPLQSLEGGYLVVYPDRYMSWSPAAAFEDGYTLIDAGGQPQGVEP